MKVERKKQDVFKPIVITLETKEEVNHMQVIACIKVDETLRECCKREQQAYHDVDSFGVALTTKLDDLFDC